jgi:hypothetical protein
MKTGEISSRYRTIGHKSNDDITEEPGLADTYTVITKL